MKTRKMNNHAAVSGVMIGFFLIALIVGGAVVYFVYNQTQVAEPETQQIIVDTTEDIDTPTFEITPAVVTSSGYNPHATLNSAKTVFTVPAWANLTGNTIVEIDNTTWEDPRFSFQIVPIPPDGATTQSLGTIFYDVSNYDARVEGDDDTYRLITKSSGEYQVIWSEGSMQTYIDGSKSVDMTENVTVYLDFDVSQGGFARMDQNDPISMTITFWNSDWTWSDTYTVNFVVQNTWGSS